MYDFAGNTNATIDCANENNNKQQLRRKQHRQILTKYSSFDVVGKRFERKQFENTKVNVKWSE